jgi:hypothetical protein
MAAYSGGGDAIDAVLASIRDDGEVVRLVGVNQRVLRERLPLVSALDPRGESEASNVVDWVLVRRVVHADDDTNSTTVEVKCAFPKR